MGPISAIRVQENGWIRVYFGRLFANGKCLDGGSAFTALNLKLDVMNPVAKQSLTLCLQRTLGQKKSSLVLTIVAV
jgi:hypothetical protein